MTDWYRTFTRVSALSILLVAVPAMAQDFPSRPVTIVTPQPPGAASDLLARTVGDRLSHAWGQPVIVDNRPGASGNVGAAFVARAPADGYTLMVGTDAMLTSNVYLFKNMPFDPVKDFAPITNGGANIICLAVSTQLPVASVPELIAYAKANPGKLQYGSSGIASPHHLSGELLAQKTGIQIVHVPYRGGGPAANDLLGGHISMAFLSLSSAVPLLTSGKIRILAVVEKTRYAAMPDIPTIGRDRPRLRDVVVARLLGARRHAGAAGRAAQRGDHQGAHGRRGEGEARQSRSRGRPQHAGRARRHHQGGPCRARATGQGRQHPGRVARPLHTPGHAPLAWKMHHAGQGLSIAESLPVVRHLCAGT